VTFAEFSPNRHLHRHGFDPRAGSPPDWLSLILAASSEAEVKMMVFFTHAARRIAQMHAGASYLRR
jgi:hypothetical protein